ATVRMPMSRATSATIGAAPVPVPPPMPAVMNTMSEPCSTSAMRSRSSSAASRPISGLAPAPRPLVTAVPSCSTVGAVMFFCAWASVLAQMKSTPSTLLITMCSRALPPPPPTPMTLMTAFCGRLSINSNMVPSPRVDTRLVSFVGFVSYCCSGFPVLPAPYFPAGLLKIPFEPPLDLDQRRFPALFRMPATALGVMPAAIVQQADAGGVDRVAYHIRQALELLRYTQAHRHVEDLFRQLDSPFHLRGAAGQHDAGGDHVLEAGAAQLGLDESEQLVVPWLHRLRQSLAGQIPRRPVADAGYLDGFL